MYFFFKSLFCFNLIFFKGITRLQDVDETQTELPERDNEESERLRVLFLG